MRVCCFTNDLRSGQAASRKTADSEQARVPFAEARRFAAERGLLAFEVSAKTGDNIMDAFRALAACVLAERDGRRPLPVPDILPLRERNPPTASCSC